VTLERSTFQRGRKKYPTGHVGAFNVPSNQEKSSYWSRWSVQRSREAGKSILPVMLARPTFPRIRKKHPTGHIGAFNVPSSHIKVSYRSRWSVQRSREPVKSILPVTLARPAFPRIRKNHPTGHIGTSN